DEPHTADAVVPGHEDLDGIERFYVGASLLHAGTQTGADVEAPSPGTRSAHPTRHSGVQTMGVRRASRGCQTLLHTYCGA
ncbi:MAG: hypothetical protein ACKPKO_27160, partial [Candidatus Fonsibacter sp.]